MAHDKYTTANAYNTVTWNVAFNGSTKYVSHGMAWLTAGVTTFEALPRHRVNQYLST